MQPPAITQLWDEALLLLGIVVLGPLVRRWAPDRRDHVRRAWVLYGFFVLFGAIAYVMRAIGLLEWSKRAWLVASFASEYALVNVLGMSIFDLALPRLRVSVQRLTAELLVGVGYILGTIGVLRQTGVDPSSLLTSTAIVSGVLALSLQATLGNILGGIALQLDGSLDVGDWVQLENGRQGKVRVIRWRHTVLETRDWDTIVVPNSMLLAGQIVILGKRVGQAVVQHRMTFYFTVDYRFPPQEVCNVVEDALRASPVDGVAREPSPVCQVQDLSRDGRDGAINYLVRYWLVDIDRDDLAQGRVRTRVVAALQRAGIPLGVHVRTVLHARSTEFGPRAEEQALASQKDVVSRLDLFAGLTEAQRAKLAGALRFVPYVRGEAIAIAGSEAKWLYVLTDGSVSVQTEGHEVARLTAPNVFGEMGLMTGERRQADVVAATDVEAYRLDRTTFESLIREEPAVAEELSNILARRKVELEAAKEGLDAQSRRDREVTESKQLLRRIRGFFGMES